MLIPIPVGVDERLRSQPVVTIALIVINLAIYVWTHHSNPVWSSAEETRLEHLAAWELQKASQGNPALAERIARYPSAIAFLVADQQWERAISDVESRSLLGRIVQDFHEKTASQVSYRYGLKPAALSLSSLVTHMFLHVDGLHLLFNMLFLWVVGSLLEGTWGSGLYAVLYAVFGVVAGLAHAASWPGSVEPAVGASGAIAGLMGAFLILHTRTPLRLVLVYGAGLPCRIKLITVPAWVFLASWIGQQLYLSAATSGINVGVSFSAHIGGFAAGVVTASVLQVWHRSRGAGANLEVGHVRQNRLTHRQEKRKTGLP